MNHFNISIVKSLVRMLGCVLFMFIAWHQQYEVAATVLAATFFVAEALGILEEKVDKRKEE